MGSSPHEDAYASLFTTIVVKRHQLVHSMIVIFIQMKIEYCLNKYER